MKKSRKNENSKASAEKRYEPASPPKTDHHLINKKSDGRETVSSHHGRHHHSNEAAEREEAVDYTEILLRPLLPPIDIIKKLKETLRRASKRWLEFFYDQGGLSALVMKLSDVEAMDEKSNEDIEIQVELFKCLKASLNNQLGIDFLAARPEVVGILALNFGNEDEYICAQTLELLTVLMVDGPEGYRAVLTAMDYFKLVKGERVRFYSLLDSLMDDEISLSFKRNVMLFLNTLVKSAMDIEERIELRADLIYCGIIDAIERLKTQSIDDFAEAGEEALSDDRIDLDNQLHIFEAVLNNDMIEVQHSYKGDSMLNLSDPEQLFQTIVASVIEYDCFGCFLSILQHLLVIPSADLAGKQQWEAAEEAIHQIVTHSDNDFTLTYEDLKKMIDWKDRLEDLSLKYDALEQKCEKMKLQPVPSQLKAPLPQPTPPPQKEIPPAPPLPGAPRGIIPPPPPLPGAPRGIVPPAPPLPGAPRGIIPPPPPLPGAPRGNVPPPPPMTGLLGKGVPPPPPPPGLGRGPIPLMGIGLPGPMTTGAKPKKENKKIGVELRNLYWTKIPDTKLQNSVWEVIDRHLGGTSTAPGNDQKLLDDKMKDLLLQNFCKNPKKVEKANDGEKKPQVAKEINLLDPKIQQNVGIALAKIHMPSTEIISAILMLDEKKLDIEKVKSLSKMALKDDEMNTLKGFEGDKDKLGKVDKFFLKTIEVPHYANRLQCWILKLNFDKDILELRKTLDTISFAIKQVRESGAFRELLQLLLAFGNFLNSGTPRGGAYGYKIDILKKIAELKDVKNKKNLLHYIAEFCSERHAELCRVSEDFTGFEEATKIPLNQWTSDFTLITKELDTLQKQLEILKKKPPFDERDQFIKIMDPFLEKARDEETNLQKYFKATEQSSIELLSQFCEDPKKVGIDDFFKEILQFLQCFDRAQAENVARALKEKKMKEMKEKAEAKKKKKEKPRREKEDFETGQKNLIDFKYENVRKQGPEEHVSHCQDQDRRARELRKNEANLRSKDAKTKESLNQIIQDSDEEIGFDAERFKKLAESGSIHESKIKNKTEKSNNKFSLLKPKSKHDGKGNSSNDNSLSPTPSNRTSIGKFINDPERGKKERKEKKMEKGLKK